MKNIYELHHENSGLLSRASFLKKEIDFLLKLIQKEYAICVNAEKLNMLDSYWEIFEKSAEKLTQLNFRIRTNEQKVEESYNSIYPDIGFISAEEEKNIEEMNVITREIQTIKESFFDFINRKNAQARA